MTKTTKEFNFKIGADPEFSIILQNKRIDAKQTILEILKDKKEFKKQNMGFSISNCGDIGWDGASQTGEIRPTPAFTPEKVISNLNNLFKAFGKYMSIFELSTLSQHASIGGHIHFQSNPNWSKQKQKTIHTQLISFYMPILMSENKINLALRIRQQYGALSDFRFERKGENNDGIPIETYEFRSPSAEWLTTPKIAQATLAYLSVIYNEITNHPRSISKYKDILLKSDKQTEAFQTLAIQEYDILNQTILRSIKKYIKTFHMYKEYQDEINFILNPKAIIKEKMKYNYDINQGWGISQAIIPATKREIISEKKFKEKIKNKDADVISRILQIDYNNDAKVSDFVNALSLRAGAFNWKLNKQYFIFGLKKGIKETIIQNAKQEFLSGLEQITTRDDYELIQHAFIKMSCRYTETNAAPNCITIDFKTGKTTSMKSNIIYIGLPYEMRMKGKTKEFINTIWDIENEKLVPLPTNPDFLNSLTSDPGEITKAKQQQKETPEDFPQNAITLADNESTSSRNQQRAIENLTIETIEREELFTENEDEVTASPHR